MHLAELGNSPSAKSSALENSRVELALCKERALDVNDQVSLFDHTNGRQQMARLEALANEQICMPKALTQRRQKQRRKGVHFAPSLQKLVDLVEKSLSEISAQSMPFVTRRKESLKQFEDLPEQFTYLKNVTFRGQVAQTPLMPKVIIA